MGVRRVEDYHAFAAEVESEQIKVHRMCDVKLNASRIYSSLSMLRYHVELTCSGIAHRVLLLSDVRALHLC